MFSIDFLHKIRAAEIEVILARFRPGARILELGAGTGQQALEIRNRGFDIEALEIPASNYSQDRLFPLTDYDGRHIPFPDASFDIVFSSNVLEHVRDLPGLHAEIKRVLRPGGTCVHVLPTHAWRFWTLLAAFPCGVQKAVALLTQTTPRPRSVFERLRRMVVGFFLILGCLVAPFFQGRHGERGNILTELWLFRPEVWRRNFRTNGFEIVGDAPMGLHYTGYFVRGPAWSLERRRRLSRTLGSACHLFELRAASAGGPPGGI